MEFNVKLQELRKKNGLTQEELAKELFVSRTAISKWESGRGYPSIDSLKAIAKFFSISIDELLSGEELLNVAEENNIQSKRQFRELVFGALDMCVVLLFFLPFFAQKSGGVIQEISLLQLGFISPYLKIVYIVLAALIIFCGVVTLALQNCNLRFWTKSKIMISVLLNTFATFVFIISMQPYAAAFMFVFLAIKALMLIKK